MAKKETFLLVSLNEKKAKKLAEVIQNNTCRKILDHLSKKDATESELSKELGVPLSTIHYNMKHLVAAKLVKSDEFHYSPKGKEVNHYSLANQYVIIAPEGQKESIKEKMKSLLPTVGLIAGATFFIKNYTGGLSTASKAMTAEVASLERAAADAAVEESFNEGVAFSAQALPQAEPQLWLWFLVGALSSLAAYFLIKYLVEKLRR